MLGNIYEEIKSPDFAAGYWAGLYVSTKDRQSREKAYERLQILIRGGKLKDPGAILRKIQ